MSDVKVTINGHVIEVPDGTTVLAAARQAGVDIPTLCDHPALVSIGACRMCLIEIMGQRCLQTACTFPVFDGIVIQTESQRVKDARKLVLDMIFSERNHFCMYCEASGNCELQDLGYRYNVNHWAYPTYTKPYPVDSSHNFYLMEHNRCVLCWRCIRGCSELAANHTLGLSRRGAKTMISADVQTPLGESTCISCGTCVQLCPTGAISEKRSAFMCKDQNIDRVKSTCNHCSVGCGIEILSRDENVIRVLGDWDAPVNRGVICRYGRFEPLYEERERLTKPLVRRNGRLEEAPWADALEAAASRIKSSEKSEIGALISSHSTNEALYLISSLFGDQLKTANLGLMNALTIKNLGPKGSFEDIADSDLILCVGTDPVANQPVASFFVKRAIDKGKKLIVADDGPNATAHFAHKNFTLSDIEKAVEAAGQADKPIVLYGPKITGRDSEILKSLGTKASFLTIEAGVNTHFAATLGIDGQCDLRAARLLYVLAAAEPWLGNICDEVDENAFIIAQASYRSDLTDRAQIVFPSAIWSEQSEA